MNKEDFTFTKDGMIFYKSRPIGISHDPDLTVYELLKLGEARLFDISIKSPMVTNYNLTTLKMLINHDNGIRVDQYGVRITEAEAKELNDKPIVICTAYVRKLEKDKKDRKQLKSKI